MATDKPASEREPHVKPEDDLEQDKDLYAGRESSMVLADVPPTELTLKNVQRQRRRIQ